MTSASWHDLAEQMEVIFNEPIAASGRTMFTEIKDEFGSIEEVGMVNSTAEAVIWFCERGVHFNEVSANDDGLKTSFDFKRVA